MCMRADDFTIPHLQVFPPMPFYQPIKNCMRTFTRSTQSLVKYAEKPLFQSQTDKNTVLPAARKYTADRKQKASENAAEWTVRRLKSAYKSRLFRAETK